ncbi:hypothetical protein GVAV_002368 [Gurleya vavrai]
MILKQYEIITKPYLNQIEILFNSSYYKLIILAVLITSLVILLFSSRLTTFIIYHHTSIVITALGWFILSKKEHPNSSYFFIGSSCAQITYFVTVKKIIKRKIGLLLILWLIYLPLILLKIMSDVLYIFLCVISLVVCILYGEFFRIWVGCFVGGCLCSGSIGFISNEKVVSPQTVFSAFLCAITGVIFNYKFMIRHKKKKIQILPQIESIAEKL